VSRRPELPRLGYGAANVGNLYRELSDDDALATMQAAWDAGIRYFDTAPHYGLGLSERRLGDFLRTKPRDEYVISTKVGRLLRPNPDGVGTLDLANDFAVPADLKRVWDFSADGVRRSLDESLQRLGLDAVDVLFLHDPEEFDLVPALAEGIPALAELRAQGMVGAIGVGSKSTQALLAAARTGELDLLMVAGRYTLLEQPTAARVLPACREHGVGVVAAAVFNSGVLARPRPAAGDRYEYGTIPADLLEKAGRIADVCESFGVDLPTAALHFPLREPAVVSVVVGGARADQVRQNAQRMTADVPEALWPALEDNKLVTM
jgi:D-threo-aldose 1-dehydrogenase